MGETCDQQPDKGDEAQSSDNVIDLTEGLQGEIDDAVSRHPAGRSEPPKKLPGVALRLAPGPSLPETQVESPDEDSENPLPVAILFRSRGMNSGLKKPNRGDTISPT